MLLQTKAQKGQKKGVSVVIGYVLLISLAIVMGGMLYSWMKSYVPVEALECPEGTSLMIEDYSCNINNEINITIKNNGNFNIGGFYIHASNNSNLDLTNIDLSEKTSVSGLTFARYEGSIRFTSAGDNNSLETGQEINARVNIMGLGSVYYLEIMPTRLQKQGNALKYASCGKSSAVKEKINCQ